MTPLHQISFLERHVVAKVIKPKLVVRAIGNVCLVLEATLFRRLARDDAPCRHSQCTENTAHEVRLVGGEVVIHCHDVNTPGRNGVQVGSQSGDQSLTFTSLHLSDVAQVQSATTHELHIKVTKAQGALGGFPYGRKGLRK